jgi:hypothetical protein
MAKQVSFSIPTNKQDIKELVHTHWHWFLILVLVVGSFAGGYYARKSYFETSIANIQRQIDGKLTDKEKELQSKDATINKLESVVLKSNEILKQALKEQDAQHNREMKDLMSKYNLKIDSLTTAYASLQGKDNMGTGSSGVIDGIRWYNWEDSYGRFRLHSPDIMKPYAEFTYNQRFKLDMVIYKQEQSDGALRTQTMHLYEIDGTGKVIQEAKIDVDLSKFRYAIDDTRIQQPAHHWLANMTSKGEIAVSWLPLNYYHNMIGLGLTGGAGADHQFVGVTAMVFPPSWAKSNFGVGASVGYDPQDSHKVAWRFQVAWDIKSLFGLK